jgi:hypothetical protein
LVADSDWETADGPPVESPESEELPLDKIDVVDAIDDIDAIDGEVDAWDSDGETPTDIPEPTGDGDDGAGVESTLFVTPAGSGGADFNPVGEWFVTGAKRGDSDLGASVVKKRKPGSEGAPARKTGIGASKDLVVRAKVAAKVSAGENDRDDAGRKAEKRRGSLEASAQADTGSGESPAPAEDASSAAPQEKPPSPNKDESTSTKETPGNSPIEDEPGPSIAVPEAPAAPLPDGDIIDSLPSEDLHGEGEAPPPDAPVDAPLPVHTAPSPPSAPAVTAPAPVPVAPSTPIVVAAPAPPSPVQTAPIAIPLPASPPFIAAPAPSENSSSPPPTRVTPEAKVEKVVAIPVPQSTSETATPPKTSSSVVQIVVAPPPMIRQPAPAPSRLAPAAPPEAAAPKVTPSPAKEPLTASETRSAPASIPPAPASGVNSPVVIIVTYQSTYFSSGTRTTGRVSVARQGALLQPNVATENNESRGAERSAEPADAQGEGQVLSGTVPVQAATHPPVAAPPATAEYARSDVVADVAALGDSPTHDLPQSHPRQTSPVETVEADPARTSEDVAESNSAVDALMHGDFGPIAAVAATASLEAIDQAINELVDELNDLGDRFADLFSPGRASPITAAAAGVAVAGVVELRFRRKRPLRTREGNWIWLYSDLLGDAPGEEP